MLYSFNEQSAGYLQGRKWNMVKEWNVGKLLSVSSGYWKGCALQAAVRLAIFTHISDKNLDSAEVADKAGTDSRATDMLLNALAAIKLLTKQNERFRNTDFALQFLSLESQQYMGHIILHHHHILDGWAQLDEAVKSGKPVHKRSYGEDIERESFLMGMFNLAMGLAPAIADQLDLSGRKHLLDLGGGPGTYAIHFCLKQPGLKATIYDRPTTEPFAAKTVASFGLSDRISFAGGDFNSEPITGGPYDVAWLSHILHSSSETECEKIIEKTAQQMSPGGMIIIHDFILSNSKDGPEFAALFSLNMLINNPSGRSYSEEEIRQMLEKAGVSSIQRHNFQSPNDSSMMWGIV